MFQLKNLINRSAVPLDPQDNTKAAEDFLMLLLHPHVIEAQNTISSVFQSESVMCIERISSITIFYSHPSMTNLKSQVTQTKFTCMLKNY